MSKKDNLIDVINAHTIVRKIGPFGCTYYTTEMDSHPFTGIRVTDFQARISDKPHLDGFFDGSPNYAEVKGVTRGKVYTITAVEGHGDMCDFTFVDDDGKTQVLGGFFFEEPDRSDG